MLNLQTKKTVSKEDTSSIKKLVGTGVFTPILINPTLAELNAAGITYIKEEPTYYDGEQGTNVIWFKNESNNYIIPMRIWSSMEQEVSKNGKPKFITGYTLSGRTLETAYADNIEAYYDRMTSYEWYKNVKSEDARILVKGEEVLTNLVFNIFALAKEDKFLLPVEALELAAKGDLEWLKADMESYKKANPDFSFDVILNVYVNDKNYTSIYENYIGIGTVASNEYGIRKALEKDSYNTDKMSDYEVGELREANSVKKDSPAPLNAKKAKLDIL